MSHTKQSHTDTPWMIKKNQDIEGYYIENNNRAIADLNFGNDEANALHIVKCVNNHDKLVESLKECQDFFEILTKGFGNEVYADSKLVKKINQTLKKCEE